MNPTAQSAIRHYVETKDADALVALVDTWLLQDRKEERDAAVQFMAAGIIAETILLTMGKDSPRGFNSALVDCGLLDFAKRFSAKESNE